LTSINNQPKRLAASEGPGSSFPLSLSRQKLKINSDHVFTC